MSNIDAREFWKETKRYELGSNDSLTANFTAIHLTGGTLVIDASLWLCRYRDDENPEGLEERLVAERTNLYGNGLTRYCITQSDNWFAKCAELAEKMRVTL